MTWPAPTRRGHEDFCKTEGWVPVRNVRGKASGHHAVTYELHLNDGRILRTRISYPPDGSTYGANIWSHILRDQLDVDEATFWACARDGKKPARSTPDTTVGDALPAELAHLLVTRLKLTRAEIAEMSREEAITRMQEYWSSPG